MHAAHLVATSSPLSKTAYDGCCGAFRFWYRVSSSTKRRRRRNSCLITCCREVAPWYDRQSAVSNDRCARKHDSSPVCCEFDDMMHRWTCPVSQVECEPSTFVLGAGTPRAVRYACSWRSWLLRQTCSYRTSNTQSSSKIIIIFVAGLHLFFICVLHQK